ncbi:hypothetical protein D3C75_1183040 [compost metagenome]
MFAGLQEGDGDFRMGIIGGTYVNHINGSVVKKLLVVCQDQGFFRSVLCLRLGCPLGDNITECSKLQNVCLFGQCRQMLAIGDPAASDNCDFQLFCHVNRMSSF